MKKQTNTSKTNTTTKRTLTLERAQLESRLEVALRQLAQQPAEVQRAVYLALCETLGEVPED